MKYHFENGMLVKEVPPVEVQKLSETLEEVKVREKLMAEGAIGLDDPDMQVANMNRPYGDPNAWRELLG